MSVWESKLKKTSYGQKNHSLNRSINSVLLIQPPAFCNNMRTDMNSNIPLGLAYIGAVLEKDGYTVKILDALTEGFEIEERVSPEKLRIGLPFGEIEKYIKEIAPDVIGISSMFSSQRKNAHAVALIAKKINPNLKVIMGGAHPTAAPESVLEDPNIDFIILGEGENSIVPLIECIEKEGDYSKLDGIGYRDNNNEIVINPKTKYVKDLDSIPFPARHLLPMDKYFSAGIRHGGRGHGKRAVSVVTTRGCPYKCNFCTAFKVFSRHPRLRTPENVLAEIRELIEDYNVDEIFFEDDQLLAKRSRALELLTGLKQYNLFWDTPNGVSPWLLNDEVLMKMKESGCYRVNLAVESGSQSVLKELINKPVRLDQVPELVKKIRQYGMEPGMFLVVGNIGSERVETLDEVRQSFRFARKLKIYPHASILTAYPGSKVLSIAEEKGYLVQGFEWDSLLINKPQLQTPEWSPSELLAVLEQERIKTRWWLILSSPIKSFNIIIEHFFQSPSETIRKLFLFLNQGLKSILRSSSI